MSKKKQYPPIKPKFLKNSQGKVTHVYLDYDVYTSIFDEIKELEKELVVWHKKMGKKQ